MNNEFKNGIFGVTDNDVVAKRFDFGGNGGDSFDGIDVDKGKASAGGSDSLDGTSDLSGILSFFGKEDPVDAPKKEKSVVDKLLDEVKGTPGNLEFLPLVEEIITMSPLVTKKKSQEIFLFQSYLFSINDGYGLDIYLELLAKVLHATGLVTFQGARSIASYRVADKDDIGEAIKLVGEARGGSPRLICFDISELMTELNSQHFKTFMKALSALKTPNIIYVFRVPYVDKDVLSRVLLNLNDMLYVRPVNFPPLGLNELKEVAERELTERGLTMSEDAWELFSARIAEEKRDGKFYGLDTVHKVVNEIIYKKLLADSRDGEEDSTISATDIEGLVVASAIDDRSGFEMLEAMVGTESIKEKILEIISQIELSRINTDLGSPSLHMRFVGNPGTGKTTVARIIGKILKEKGVLRIGDFFEYAGRDFVGRYIGETAPKVTGMCRDAYGSVLFIDEAYSLCRDTSSDSKDFGKEALDTLIAEMENHRDDFVVIMAGYTDDMDIMMKGNAGLASRIPYTIEFPNFTREQLYQIFVKMLGNKLEYEPELLEDVKKYFDALTDNYINAKEFSNARFVRNLFERTFGKAALRCQLSGETKIVLTRADFTRATADREFASLEAKRTARIGF